jgi:hypothetical protein
MKLWSNLRRWLRGAPGPAETPQPRRPDVTPDIAQLVEGNVALARQQVAQLTGAAGAPGRAGGENWDRFKDSQRAMPDSEIDDAGRERIANMVGCYIGAALIAEYGGRWIDDGGTIGVEISPRLVVYPINKTRKHMQNGAEDSVLSMFDMVPHLLQDTQTG